MTREDIIRMAREANIGTYINLDSHLVGNHLERFAALVAAAEREACAKVCEAVHASHIAEYGDYIGETYAITCVAAIRAKGQE